MLIYVGLSLKLSHRFTSYLPWQHVCLDGFYEELIAFRPQTTQPLASQAYKLSHRPSSNIALCLGPLSRPLVPGQGLAGILPDGHHSLVTFMGRVCYRTLSNYPTCHSQNAPVRLVEMFHGHSDVTTGVFMALHDVFYVIIMGATNMLPWHECGDLSVGLMARWDGSFLALQHTAICFTYTDITRFGPTAHSYTDITQFIFCILHLLFWNKKLRKSYLSTIEKLLDY